MGSNMHVLQKNYLTRVINQMKGRQIPSQGDKIYLYQKLEILIFDKVNHNEYIKFVDNKILL